MRKLLRRLGGATLGFALAKACVFFAPLAQARLLGLADYGALEVSLAKGGMLAPLLACGMASAIPYFILHRKKVSYQYSISAYTLLLGCVSALIVLGASWVQEGYLFQLTMVFSTIAAMQFMQSAKLKVHGHAALASTIESGMYIVLLLVAVLGIYFKISPGFGGILGGMLAYQLLLMVLAGRGMFEGNIGLSHHVTRLGIAYSYGIRLVPASLGMLVLVNGGRILSGSMLGFEDTGIFGLLFRLSAPAVLVHQLFATVFFKRLYIADKKDMDVYFTLILAGVTAAAIIAFLLTPYFAAPLLHVSTGLLEQHKTVHLIISLQMILWVALALIEPILSRERLFMPQFSALIGCCAIALAIILMLSRTGTLNLLTLCVVQLGAFAGTFVFQLLALRRAGVWLSKMLLYVATVIFVPAIFSFFL